MDEMKTKAEPTVTCEVKVTRVDGSVERYTVPADIEDFAGIIPGLKLEQDDG